MSKAKIYDVTATGSVVPRDIRDRFADVINVKDFGAVGDGVTDDTAAFEAAGAAGKAVFVPEGTYKVTRQVEGVFFSQQGAAVPFVDVRTDRDAVHPLLATVTPLEVGGDIPTIFEADPRKWAGATQGHFCDPYDKVLYIARENAAGKSAMHAIRWSEREEERILLGATSYEYNKWAHQTNSLYRPSPAHPPRFFVQAAVNIAADVTDNTQKFKARLLSWDYKDAAKLVTVLKEFVLFESSDFDENKAIHFCVSTDAKYIIGFAHKRTGELMLRVWDAASIIEKDYSGTAIDVTKTFLWENVLETDPGAGQGIYSDGRFVYTLTGSNLTYIKCLTLDGKLCFQRPIKAYLSDVFSAYKSEAEPESVFWAPYYGRIEMFLAISNMVYNVPDNAESYTRYNRYWALSVAGSYKFEGQFASWEAVTDLDDAVEAGYYRFENEAANVPVTGGGGYIQVVRSLADTWPIMQIVTYPNFIGGIDRKPIMYIRKGLIDKATKKFVSQTDWCMLWNDAWIKTANGQYVFSPPYGPQDVGQTASSYEHIRLYHFKDFRRDATRESYGFISRYTEEKAPNTTGVSSQMRFGSNEGGRGGIPFIMVAKQMTDEGGTHIVDSADFRFNQDGKASLGVSSVRWAQLYAATDTINTSDVREKTAVANPDEALMRAWGKVNFKAFQFTDAVEKKGEDARIHFGVIAQQVMEAFAEEGLDASRYALFCYDKWDDEWEEQEDGTKVLVTPAGDRYGIRYSEALALECAYQRWRLDKLEAKLNTGSTGYSVS